jgi:ribosome-associated heat shock protein Hsp15
MDSTRVDKWLWAVRAYPTRTAATDGCQGGHVRVNGSPAKPAASVKIGDRVVVKGHGTERIFEVTRVIDKRVGAPVAAECFIDHSPPPVPPEHSAPLLTRDRATGRPTKKDRRQIDKFRRS